MFRADKPQQVAIGGVVQCDADIFGSRFPSHAEILALFYNIFQDLGLSNIRIEYDDRQLLIDNCKNFANDRVSGSIHFVQSIDKLDKFKPNH